MVGKPKMGEMIKKKKKELVYNQDPHTLVLLNADAPRCWTRGHKGTTGWKLQELGSDIRPDPSLPHLTSCAASDHRFLSFISVFNRHNTAPPIEPKDTESILFS